MPSTRFTTGQTMTLAGPSGSGSWNLNGWVKIDSYTLFTQGFCFRNAGGTYVVGSDTGETVATAHDAFVNIGTPGFNAQAMTTGSFAGWLFVSFQFTAAASTVLVRYVKDADGNTFSSFTLPVETVGMSQLTTLCIANAVFSDPADTSFVALRCYSRVMSDAELIAEANSATVVSTTNLVAAPDLSNPAAPNIGLSGTSNWTLTGTPASDASVPTRWSSPAAVADTSRLRTQRRALGFPPRAPIPGIPRIGAGFLSTPYVAPYVPPVVAVPPEAPMAQPQPRSFGFGRRYPAPPTAQLGVGFLRTGAAPSSTVVNAACDLTAGFGLAATAEARMNAAAALAAGFDVAIIGAQARASAATALSAGFDLTATGRAIASAVAALDASGALAVTGQSIASATAAMAAAAGLAATSEARASAVCALAAGADLAAVGRCIASAATALDASVAVAVTGRSIASSTAALDAAAALAAQGGSRASAAAALAASFDLSGSTGGLINASADLSFGASLAGTAQARASSTAALAAAADLVAAGQARAGAVAALSASADLAVQGRAIASSTAALSTAWTLATTTSGGTDAACSMAVGADLAVTGRAIASAASALSMGAGLTAAATRIMSASCALGFGVALSGQQPSDPSDRRHTARISRSGRDRVRTF